MTTDRQTMQPGDYLKFGCIASDCEDSCCCGWKIGIDKETGDKYKAGGFPELKRLFEEKIVENEAGASDFAEITLSDNCCPFLTEQRLCRIQSICGESFLSQTCGNFPRNMNFVDGMLERSLHLSCPEAARIILLNPDPMQFKQTQEHGIPAGRLANIPELNTSDRNFTGKPYRLFHDIRRFVIALLQNRGYIFEDRLIILGLFCNDLDKLSDTDDPGAAQDLIDRYAHRIEQNDFESVIKMIPAQPAALLKVLVVLIEYRIQTGVTGERFHNCFAEFKKGIDYLPGIADTDLAVPYLRAKSCYYEPFMSRHEFIYENYFVNYVFKTLFPLGPQKGSSSKSIYRLQKDIFTEYVLLVFHYAIIKNFLIGLSGFYQDAFGEEQVIRLIQSFAKNIDHDVPYLKRVLQFFNENHMVNFACTAMLVKN
jgi:hypothetical protein